MKQEDYNKILEWFNAYVNEFSSEDDEIQNNIKLKIDHSLRSVSIITELAQKTNASETDIVLAQAAVLLHDIGRFQQLKEFETFADTEKVNHSEIGLQILESNKVLEHLSEEDQEIIKTCIQYHESEVNLKSLEEKCIYILGLVRDADKIDILSIMAHYYSYNRAGTNRRLEFELSDKSEISEQIYSKIMDEKTADKKDVLTITDLKLMQMSWIFGFSTKKSYQIISEKTLLKQIYDTLPKKDNVIDMYRSMKIYMENQL